MANENKGFYKLSFLQRVGFGSGDMAQNLIYQTISIWLLIFYTNVFGLDPKAAALMFLVVRLVDVLWDPVVGALIDKNHPKWGKYRSWLIFGGVPLTGLAILCFWNGVENHRLLYAYITYVGMSMCYTLVNVPYGAINSSLTRDTDEITKLTATRMFMANLGGLIVKTVPLIVAGIFLSQNGTKFEGIVDFFKKTAASDNVLKSPDSAHAWFITMLIFALVGFAFLIFCFTQSKERVVMDEKESANVKASDLFTEFARNRPLRILAFFFITAFAMMSISNAADSYYMTYNLNANSGQTTLFMWLGTIPAFIFMPLVPAIKKRIGKTGMFYLFLLCAVAGMTLQYLFTSTELFVGNFWLLYIVQFVKSTGIIVATGYMWALVPEVVAYGEFTTGRRIAGIVNALTGIFFKAGMALGGVVPGLVIAAVGFYAPQDKTMLEQVEAEKVYVDAVSSATNSKDLSDSYLQLSAAAADTLSGKTFKEYALAFEANAASFADKAKEIYAANKDYKSVKKSSKRLVKESKQLNKKAEDLVKYSNTLESNKKSFTAADANQLVKKPVQTNMAKQGILWLVTIIPALLLLLAMWIISKYELSDEKMDEINKAIEAKAAEE
jgi:GPH family glycoside/pentoside/hexuronide:cation symporter